jgi:hypothetical protein
MRGTESPISFFISGDTINFDVVVAILNLGAATIPRGSSARHLHGWKAGREAVSGDI